MLIILVSKANSSEVESKMKKWQYYAGSGQYFEIKTMENKKEQSNTITEIEKFTTWYLKQAQ